MPRYKLRWGWDGTDEGEMEYDADDEEDARGEAWSQYNMMMNDRGHFSAEKIDD